MFRSFSKYETIPYLSTTTKTKPEHKFEVKVNQSPLEKSRQILTKRQPGQLIVYNQPKTKYSQQKEHDLLNMIVSRDLFIQIKCFFLDYHILPP